MAEVSVGYRNTLCSKKCAILSSKRIDLDIGDESPDGTSEFAFTTFFGNDHNSHCSNNLISERDDDVIDKDFFNHSHVSLSRNSHNANRQPSTDSEIDNGLLELLDSSKSPKNSVPLLEKNKCKNRSDESNKMKINSNQVGGLSDILTSLCIRDENLTKIKHDNNANENTLLDSIDVPDVNIFENECRKPSDNSFKEEESLSELLSSINNQDSNNRGFGKSNLNNTQNVKKLDDIESNANFNLSDMLGSLNIENTNTSKPTMCKELLLNSEEMHTSLKDFYCTSNFARDLTLDANCSSSNDSCASSYSDAEDDSTCDSLRIKKSHLNDEINDSDSGISSFGSLKQEFSFFNSSETMDSFNLLLEQIDENKNGNVCEDRKIGIKNEAMNMCELMNTMSDEYKDNNKSKKDSSEWINGSEDCMSMMDLMKSIDFEPEILLSKSSSSSKIIINSDSCKKPLTTSFKDTDKRMESVKIDSRNVEDSVLQTKNNLFDDEGGNVGDDEEQITCIDLRACIKSTEKSSNSLSPLEMSEKQSSKCFSPIKNGRQSFDCTSPPRNFDDEKKNDLLLQMLPIYSYPVNFIESSPLKNSRVNSKQSLFSMALACKPKKNPHLGKKIASIKSELYEKFANRPLDFEKNMQQPSTEPGLHLNHCVQLSEQCIISHAGHKSFGMETSFEL
ncbi:uncharacterized protein NPIL_692601 [Nephila pilipes]|uniref:Uncharacterized protein n=1 Tax=Nephila pilipes TaxID=299642 RepID=A0A8X6MP02_NEPPI|nr:uncharacterized protein NPIL_692601 [Nephila pilipes]